MSGNEIVQPGKPAPKEAVRDNPIDGAIAEVYGQGDTSPNKRSRRFNPTTDTTFTPRRFDVWDSFVESQPRSVVQRVNFIATEIQQAVVAGIPINVDFVNEVNRDADRRLGPADPARPGNNFDIQGFVTKLARPEVAAQYRDAISDRYRGFKAFPYDSNVVKRDILDFDSHYVGEKTPLGAVEAQYPNADSVADLRLGVDLPHMTVQQLAGLEPSAVRNAIRAEANVGAPSETRGASLVPLAVLGGAVLDLLAKRNTLNSSYQLPGFELAN